MVSGTRADTRGGPMTSLVGGIVAATVVALCVLVARSLNTEP